MFVCRLYVSDSAQWDTLKSKEYILASFIYHIRQNPTKTISNHSTSHRPASEGQKRPEKISRCSPINDQSCAVGLLCHVSFIVGTDSYMEVKE
jgi:hypothetical protein